MKPWTPPKIIPHTTAVDYLPKLVESLEKHLNAEPDQKIIESCIKALEVAHNAGWGWADGEYNYALHFLIGLKLK